MNIIHGRGRRRRSFVFPCAAIVNRSPKPEQDKGLELLCQFLDVPLDSPGIGHNSVQIIDGQG